MLVDIFEKNGVDSIKNKSIKKIEKIKQLRFWQNQNIGICLNSKILLIFKVLVL